jgi:hypothetical protein
VARYARPAKSEEQVRSATANSSDAFHISRISTITENYNRDITGISNAIFAWDSSVSM